MAEYETHTHDVLVVGAGGAGLRAAIEAASTGARVGLVCKSLLGKAHTVMAEGGVAAALYSSSWLPPGSALVPPLTLGVFAGIVAWFALVARLARSVGARIALPTRRRLSRVVALLLLALAIALLVLAVRG